MRARGTGVNGPSRRSPRLHRASATRVIRDCKGRCSLCQGCGNRVPATIVLIPKGRRPLTPVQGTISLENPASGAAKYRAHTPALCEIRDCKGTVFLCQGCGNDVPAIKGLIPKGRRPLTSVQGTTSLENPMQKKVAAEKFRRQPFFYLYHNRILIVHRDADKIQYRRFSCIPIRSDDKYAARPYNRFPLVLRHSPPRRF